MQCSRRKLREGNAILRFGSCVGCLTVTVRDRASDLLTLAASRRRPCYCRIVPQSAFTIMLP